MVRPYADSPAGNLLRREVIQSVSLWILVLLASCASPARFGWLRMIFPSFHSWLIAFFSNLVACTFLERVRWLGLPITPRLRHLVQGERIVMIRLLRFGIPCTSSWRTHQAAVPDCMMLCPSNVGPVRNKQSRAWRHEGAGRRREAAAARDRVTASLDAAMIDGRR